MKKITYTILGVILLLAIQSKAQTLIAVQNGSSPKFYSILQDAITNAQNKDTIYIPGGAYSFTNSKITIDKELHLIGTGHYPDSTIVSITQLNAVIYLITGANNSSFEGFYLNGDFKAGTTTADEDVDNIIISRCNSSSILLSRLSTNWLVRENVIRGCVRGNNVSSSSSAQSNLFSNNIIEGYIASFATNNIFRNNIFLFSTVYWLSGIDGCTFQNNIITNSSNQLLTSNILDNNLFFSTFTFPSGCIGNNNIYSQTREATFINQIGNAYSYAHDYHLKSTSPGKGAGRDGSDVGIYGGVYSWKAGSVPANPHFQRVQIAPKTDNTGNLNVKIKVAAQDN